MRLSRDGCCQDSSKKHCGRPALPRSWKRIGDASDSRFSIYDSRQQFSGIYLQEERQHFQASFSDLVPIYLYFGPRSNTRPGGDTPTSQRLVVCSLLQLSAEYNRKNESHYGRVSSVGRVCSRIAADNRYGATFALTFLFLRP